MDRGRRTHRAKIAVFVRRRERRQVGAGHARRTNGRVVQLPDVRRPVGGGRMLVPRGPLVGRLSTDGIVSRDRMSRRQAAARHARRWTTPTGSRHHADRATMTDGTLRARATTRATRARGNRAPGASRCVRAGPPATRAMTGMTVTRRRDRREDARSEPYPRLAASPRPAPDPTELGNMCATLTLVAGPVGDGGGRDH